MLINNLAIGTLPVLLTMMAVRIKYRTPLWKLLILSVALIVAGFYSARVMSMIESGSWGGRRFFGVVFFAPLLMIPLARLLRLPVADVLDQCAPAECVMMTLSKLRCLADGCCYGKVLWYGSNEPVRFPSQIAEAMHAFALAVVMVTLMRRGKMRSTAFPWYMILYGIGRFILHLFRDNLTYIAGLPTGNFWSLISITIGTIWILFYKKTHPVTAKQK